jgi:hypothetical protein
MHGTLYRLLQNVSPVIILSIISLYSAYTQTERQQCGTVAYTNWLREQFPGTYPSDDLFEQWMATEIDRRKKSTKRNAETVIRTIPVIFHIFHEPGQAVGSGSNITAAQIQSQIDALNEDFRRLGNGSNNHPVGADCRIEFCLALVNANNQWLAEPGIMRWSNWGSGPFYLGFVEANLKPPTSQDPTRFLNFWVADLRDGYIGYAQFPSGSGLPGLNPTQGASTDGVVVIPQATGRTGNLTFPYVLGRTAAHEIGHWLGLRHLWGDGNCTVDDYCNDTPVCYGAFYSQFPDCEQPLQCGSLRMIQNYMDYSNDGCMNLFTKDQKARMDVVLANSPRRPWSEAIPTVCHPELASLHHSPLSVRSCGSTTILFYNQPEATPSSVKWTFSGISVTPLNSIQPSVQVSVSSTGTLTAKLEATHQNLSEIKSKELSVIIYPLDHSACLTPSCNDGIRNGNEIGIDCGGSCPQNCQINCDQVIVYNGPYIIPENSQAGKYIEAGNLTGAGEVELIPGQNISLQARDSILLQGGFAVEAGAVFQIQLQGCN